MRLRLGWLFTEPQGRNREKLAAFIGIWVAAAAICAAFAINYAWQRESSEMERAISELQAENQRLKSAMQNAWNPHLPAIPAIGLAVELAPGMELTDEDWEYFSSWTRCGCTKRFRTVEEAAEEYR